jgi:hypothetical protein
MLRLLLITASLAAACNSYDPDLGSVPFRCGSDEPRCPLGYTCVSYSADDELCELTGGDPGGDGGDGNIDSSFDCANDDEIEPNDDMASATNTLIPSVNETYRLVNLSICPDTDVDVFLFGVVVAPKNLQADVEYMSANGQLVLEVLNAAGAVIGTGEAVDGMPDLLRAEVPNLPSNPDYYVRVSAPAGVQNNYTIDIAVTGN